MSLFQNVDRYFINKTVISKTKIRGAVASQEQPNPILIRRWLLSSTAVTVYFIFVKFYTVLSSFYFFGRGIIEFNHGSPRCLKNMTLGTPVSTKPSGFSMGFCGDRSLSRHVFHTSHAMIKTIKHQIEYLHVCFKSILSLKLLQPSYHDLVYSVRPVRSVHLSHKPRSTNQGTVYTWLTWY